MTTIVLMLTMTATPIDLKSALASAESAEVHYVRLDKTIGINKADLKDLSNLISFEGEVKPWNTHGGALGTNDVFEIRVRKGDSESVFSLVDCYRLQGDGNTSPIGRLGVLRRAPQLFHASTANFFKSNAHKHSIA